MDQTEIGSLKAQILTNMNTYLLIQPHTEPSSLRIIVSGNTHMAGDTASFVARVVSVCKANAGLGHERYQIREILRGGPRASLKASLEELVRGSGDWVVSCL